MNPRTVTSRVLDWYFRLNESEGSASGRLPFYCDPERVGALAVAPDDLAAGGDAAIFRLFVTLSMYQALRDVVVMRHQRSLTGTATRAMADVAFVKRSIARHSCGALNSADEFEALCDVWKRAGVVECDRCPGSPCHVKNATAAFNRMGDMGKLPTSAWLRLWKNGGVRKVVADVCRAEPSPERRAARLVEQFARVHRVGRKLATMFVSALSTPALAPGLTPWFPRIDGSTLVVVDTNVARAVDALRSGGSPRTYAAREQWIREQAAGFDLRKYRPDLPRFSPRLVQQAFYAFSSKSNRVALGDVCATRPDTCATCAPAVCPFVRGKDSRPRPGGGRDALGELPETKRLPCSTHLGSALRKISAR